MKSSLLFKLNEAKVSLHASVFTPCVEVSFKTEFVLQNYFAHLQDKLLVFLVPSEKKLRSKTQSEVNLRSLGHLLAKIFTGH